MSASDRIYDYAIIAYDDRHKKIAIFSFLQSISQKSLENRKKIN